MTTQLTQALKRSLLSVFVFVIIIVASQLQADSQTVPQGFLVREPDGHPMRLVEK